MTTQVFSLTGFVAIEDEAEDITAFAEVEYVDIADAVADAKQAIEDYGLEQVVITDNLSPYPYAFITATDVTFVNL